VDTPLGQQPEIHAQQRHHAEHGEDDGGEESIPPSSLRLPPRAMPTNTPPTSEKAVSSRDSRTAVGAFPDVT
jgi:hypothetical protein